MLSLKILLYAECWCLNIPLDMYAQNEVGENHPQLFAFKTLLEQPGTL